MRRSEIIDILDGTHARVGRGVAFAIYAMIMLSSVVIALETVPGLPDGVRRALHVTEYTVLSVFAMEYLLRLTCAPRPLAYAVSFWGLVDFVAVIPALLFLFPDLATIRSMRLLRLFRLMKLFKANRALDRITRAFEKVRAELFIFLLIGIVILYLSAVGIYHFEHRAQPEAFGSIPASLWWALATLTTVGYGDVYPVTIGGRMFTGLVLMVGFGVIAVPAGLITAALMDGGKGAETPRASDGLQSRYNSPKTEDNDP